MIGILIGIVVVAVLALLFGFIANFAFARLSAVKRAAIAGIAVSCLISLPALAGVLGPDMSSAAIIAIAVAAIMMAAFGFAIALIVTRLKKSKEDESVFE